MMKNEKNKNYSNMTVLDLYWKMGNCGCPFYKNQK